MPPVTSSVLDHRCLLIILSYLFNEFHTRNKFVFVRSLALIFPTSNHFYFDRPSLLLLAIVLTLTIFFFLGSIFSAALFFLINFFGVWVELRVVDGCLVLLGSALLLLGQDLVFLLLALSQLSHVLHDRLFDGVGSRAKDVDDVWQGEGLLLEELLCERLDLFLVLFEQGLARAVALVDDAMDLLVDEPVCLLRVILLVA